ncbi:PTS system D-fructose-specific IIA component (F1P-forming), Frc family [Gracilibacillus orientalis]|uniref:PTS system D-fructose-specific IIA component (F1P-forming), Frc family n=1 Tax=Gracilibacillus orientalis TaxID=334253 RepID=A0A1I4HYE3_9BACI|nr:fructose PTS transporter subunit IIA [Gracilibacillus orientalis]SFL46813.1 PTS system D-fructose-specific IIA component (F1P-forming), Frc family [Gracilibacillus orientalis]
MDNKLLDINQIKLKQQLTTQEEVFEQIAAIAVTQGIASDPEEVVVGLQKREQESTTGFQDGFAIPHAQVDAIKRPAIVVVSSKEGIEWNALDRKPATFFIALLVPKREAGTTHIQSLASISRMLIYEEKREVLAHAEDANTVMEELAGAFA